MNAANLKVLATAGTAALGIFVGAVIGKVVLDKAPAAKPVLVWASGALIGVGATLLATPPTKSEAASILATPAPADSE